MFYSKAARMRCIFLGTVSSFFINLVLAEFRNDFQSAYTDCGEIFISQDGPVTLDIPITFTVNTTCSLEGELYAYVFRDNVDPPHEKEVSGQHNASISIAYPESIYNPGTYLMTVTPYIVLSNSLYIRLTPKTISFELTRYIPGNLSLTGIIEKYDKIYAPSGDPVNMTLDLYFPSHIMEVSEFSYSWHINDDQFISTVPAISYTFEEPSVYLVHVAVVARIPVLGEADSLPDVKYKWRSFSQEINVKAPFHSINLTGQTYLKHGELFSLNVSCNGSGPFEYCWKVLDPSDVGKVNLTCLSPVVTNQCRFPIIYYFHKAGDYEVAIRIDNFVSDLQKNVQVRVFDVLRRAQLSTVIIPLSCSILVILIIAAGVMLHLRRNQQIDVETADFDFLQSDACVIETFWECLFRTVLNALLFGRYLSRPSYLCLSNRQQESNTQNQYDSTDTS